MSRRALHLMIDTNILIQCKVLEDIDWGLLGDFAEIHLLVCPAVIREIDDLKVHRNDRVQRRARTLNRLFKQMLRRNDGPYLPVSAGDPEVKLILAPECKPSEELALQLDYTNPDDALVGSLRSYRDTHPELDSRLASDDTGPNLKAQMVGLPSIEVPDAWLLPPDNSKEARELIQLRAECDRLKAQEPAFSVDLSDYEGNRVERLELEYLQYQALSDNEVAQLTSLVKVAFPPADEPAIPEFDESERERSDSEGRFVRRYVPPTTADWATYREKTYPAWLSRCEEVFRDLHNRYPNPLRRLPFTVLAKNNGTRPGKDVMVVIRARGSFKLWAPDPELAKEQSEVPDDDQKTATLPEPPEPPGWKWLLEVREVRKESKTKQTVTSRMFDEARRAAALAESMSPKHLLGGSLGDGRFEPIIDPFPPSAFDLSSLRRDPNEFYWKSDRPSRPVNQFQYECAQWRHEVDAERFHGEICYRLDKGDIRGALEVQIHAENLSSPFSKRFPVRIAVKEGGIREAAEELVEDLRNRVGTQSEA